MFTVLKHRVVRSCYIIYSIKNQKTELSMKGTFPIHKFRELETPFYYYDTNLLRHTLDTIRKEAGKYNKFCVHYAVKANANPKGF